MVFLFSLFSWLNEIDLIHKFLFLREGLCGNMNGNKKDDLTLASNASILVGPVEFGNSHKIGGAAVGWVGAITSETILIICRYFQQNFALRQPLANRVYNVPADFKLVC